MLMPKVSRQCISITMISNSTSSSRLSPSKWSTLKCTRVDTRPVSTWTSNHKLLILWRLIARSSSQPFQQWQPSLLCLPPHSVHKLRSHSLPMKLRANWTQMSKTYLLNWGKSLAVEEQLTYYNIAHINAMINRVVWVLFKYIKYTCHK